MKEHMILIKLIEAYFVLFDWWTPLFWIYLNLFIPTHDLNVSQLLNSDCFPLLLWILFHVNFNKIQL